MCRPGSLTSSRMRSAAATPPGSRSRRTRMPRSCRACLSASASVVFPDPSIPSIVISLALRVMDRSTLPRTRIEAMLAELDRHAHARAVLGPVLAADRHASHAYLFYGPGGAGKRAAARAVAAELLASGSPHPESARARALAGVHPDLTWVIPSGAHEILVSDIHEPVVAAASKTPFEANSRVFVIERVDELGDEAANRMLKTLEEPASFVHLILLTDRLVEVLPTIRSRCQLVRFDAPPVDEVAAAVEALGVPSEVALASARLSLGDAERARELAGPDGQELRAAAESFAGAVLTGRAAADKPWSKLLGAVRTRGEATRAELEARAAAELELYPRKERKRIEPE